jgi:putative endonuclease
MSAVRFRVLPNDSPGNGTTGHFVYILTCADATLYTGYTTDPDRRLKEHNSGKASKYTRARLPVRLSFLEKAPSRGAALRREFEIKKLGRPEKMRLCRGFPDHAVPSSR